MAAMLNQLSDSLKLEVYTDIYSKFLFENSWLKKNFSEEFLLKLAPEMRETTFYPEEIIFRENEYIGKMFFLVNGDVKIQISTKNMDNEKFTVLETIKKN